jgi:hypothetical protein
MAKAKKQEATGAEAGGTKKAAGAKPQAKAKAPAKKSAPTGAPGVPLIDTSLAASAAASMVLNRAGGAANAPAASGDAEGAGDKRETSTFKQLKQGLSKGGSQGINGLLGGVQGGKKVTQTFAGPNQVRRNQTFGADASRTNVPRRTGG